jgi:hypothetical protein
VRDCWQHGVRLRQLGNKCNAISEIVYATLLLNAQFKDGIGDLAAGWKPTATCLQTAALRGQLVAHLRLDMLQRHREAN